MGKGTIATSLLRAAQKNRVQSPIHRNGIAAITFRYGPNAHKSDVRAADDHYTPKLTQNEFKYGGPYVPGKNEKAVKFELARPFKGHRLTPPESVESTTPGELLHFYKTMAYYRRFEIVADLAYKQRLIRGFCHLYDGQEAIVTGISANLKLGLDSLITSYRDHVYQLAMGDSGENTMAELFGREPGCARGKGGSMHMYYPRNRFYGGNGIVGAQVPLGAGIALAHKYRNDGGIAIAGYGDGAANQGQVFEAFNMAFLYKLPVIFLCENNQYGMGTSVSRSSMNTDFYTRGDVIPGLWIDGMDVLACKKGFAFAMDWCRSGKGPIVVEASTYRYHGHSMSDPGVSYRSRDEVDQMRSHHDPIEQAKHKLLSNGWCTEEELKAIDKEIRKTCDAHVEFAKNAHELPIEEIFTDIYANKELPYLRPVDFRKARDGSKGLIKPI